MTDQFDLLQHHLHELIYEFQVADIQLVLGGGFGLYLKRRHVLASGARTLLSALPDARSTNDLDLILQTEVLADAAKAGLVVAILARLGYEPEPAARYFQFSRALPGLDRRVKVDLLTGPLHGATAGLRVDKVRVKASGKVPLHARLAADAIGLGTLTTVPVASRQPGTLFLPHPFTYTLMKIHAFADRQSDGDQDFGRHHALDLYALVAMMTENEWDEARTMRRQHAAEAPVVRAAELVADLFADRTSAGTLRLREHPQGRQLDPGDLATFLELLRELWA